VDGIFQGEKVMAKMKDFLIGVEELVYTALEKGFTDLYGIHAYVHMYEPLADVSTVSAILDELHRMDELQLYVA
jgi:hypothetical protein